MWSMILLMSRLPGCHSRSAGRRPEKLGYYVRPRRLVHVHPPIANPGPVSVSTHIPDSFLEKVFTIVAQMTAPSSNNRSRQSTKLSGLGGHRVNDSDPAKIQNH